MDRPELVVLSRRGRDSIDAGCWAVLEAHARVTVVQLDRSPALAEAAELLASADLLGSTNLCLPHLDAELLDALPRLRGIVLYATGYDHVDVPLLRSRGVGLSVLPEYATTAVAEHSLAMLMAMATRLHLAHDRSRGTGPPDASLRGVELAGRTLGVIGVGRIGRHLAAIASAIGMNVIGHDIDADAVSRARAAGLPMTDLSALLRSSDAVALCASHRFGAPPVVGQGQLSLMRRGSFLVNAARSALADTDAVVAAVRRGDLRGYAVDDAVLDLARDGDLLDEGRVLQTGHSAWWRDEVLARGARMWGERLVAAVHGAPLDAVTWRSHTVWLGSARPARTRRPVQRLARA